MLMTEDGTMNFEQEEQAMDGTIFFSTPEALAAFLVAFTGNTATFTVTKFSGGFLLTFTRGC